MEKQNNKEFAQKLVRKTYRYSLKIIILVDSLSNQLSCRVIANQLVRSGTSIGANVIEAQAASSKRDFVNFLSYALKSANETKFWLGLLRDSKKGNKEKINQLLEKTQELASILGSSIATLKGKRKL